ncbi:MAG TPA: DUF3572 domain-containing protein [Hyphomicrobiales bacterium]|nr:DUF3572 domain-containing protein [Hyphomicrobiales bacterium]
MQPSRERGNAATRREAANALGARALGFLAADPERLGRFLALSGIDPRHIREAAQSPHFLAGVLDHMLADEAGLLLPFAAEASVSPEEVAAARIALDR